MVLLTQKLLRRADSGSFARMKVVLLGDSIPEQSFQSATLNSEAERARIKYADRGQLFPCPHVSGRDLPPHDSAFPLSPFTCWTQRRSDQTQGGSECGLTIPASRSGLATSRGCPLGLLHPQEQHTCRGPGDSFLGSDWKSFSIGPN